MTYDELKKLISDVDIARFMLICLDEESREEPAYVILIKKAEEAKYKLKDFGVEFDHDV